MNKYDTELDVQELELDTSITKPLIDLWLEQNQELKSDPVIMGDGIYVQGVCFTG